MTLELLSRAFLVTFWFGLAFFLGMRIGDLLSAQARRADAEADMLRFDLERQRADARGESVRV